MISTPPRSVRFTPSLWQRVAGVVCLWAPLSAGAAEPADAFAYAVPITLSGPDALNRLEVPQVVYEGVLRADLSDLRVVNASGEPVPHALKPRARPDRDPAPTVDLPYFPLKGSHSTHSEQLEVRTERTRQGSIVRVITSGRESAALLRAYLVDASKFNAPLSALDLDWRSPEAGYSGSLRVEGSDDLRHWRTLIASAPLLSLSFGGHELARKSVELPTYQSRYLRLSWPMTQPPLELTRLRGRPSDVRREPSRQWKRVESRAGENAGEYWFEPAGRMPVDRLRIALPLPNTLVSVEVLARSSDNEPWQRLNTAVLYRLTHEGREAVNADLAVAGSGRRQWLLKVDQRGGGLGGGTPTIEVGWVPQELVFVARGAPPFELIFGNARAQRADLAIQELVPGWRSDAELKAQAATTGAQRTLAGQRALEPSLNYRVWALWASLALGVAILAWMALQLARQLRAQR